MNCTVYFPPRWNTLSFFIKYGTKRDVVDAIGLIGWSGSGGEGEATHFFLSAPTPPSSVDKYAFGSFRHSHFLAHSLSSTRDGRQFIKGIPIRFVETCHGGTLAVDWSIGRFGGEGWKCSQIWGWLEKYHLGCKILLSLRRKADRHLGLGVGDSVVIWLIPEIDAGERFLPKTNLDCTAVMVLDFWAKSAWDRVRRLLVLGFF